MSNSVPLLKKAMRVTELLKVGAQLLEIMSENNIMRDDYRYLKSYEEFRNMRANRVKYRVAIRELARENNISERTLERIFKRLSREC